jgi:hypothetical protein
MSKNFPNLVVRAFETRTIRPGKSIFCKWRPAFAALRRGIFSRGEKMVGVTGVEPVTLRLSSACSNQLSYTPNAASPQSQISNLEFEIQGWWS